MSSNKIIIEKINSEILKQILEESIYKDYNCEDFSFIFRSFFLYKMIGSKFSQISYSTSDFGDIIEKINSINMFPYSIGIPILKIIKSKVFPLLPLGDIMIKYCKNKIYLPYSISMKLAYGKPIKLSEIINFRKGLAVTNNKFIAYVKVENRGRNTLIIPDLDIGWYLRRGG